MTTTTVIEKQAVSIAEVNSLHPTEKYQRSPIRISATQHQILEGLIVSDAHVTPYGQRKGKNSEFRLNVASEQFSDLVLKNVPFLNQSLISVKKYPNNIYYLLQKGNVSFNEYRDRWYVQKPEGFSHKEIPVDFEITPLSMLYWFLGDGSKNINGYGIRLHTQGFTPKDVKLLCYMITEAIGVPAKPYKHNLVSDNPYVGYYSIYIGGKSNVAKFLGYIGECPFAQYRHKWENGLKAADTFKAGLPKVIDLSRNDKAVKRFKVKSIINR